MGLRKDFVLSTTGITFAGAHLAIHRVEIDLVDGSAEVRIAAYKDKAAMEGGATPFTVVTRELKLGDTAVSTIKTSLYNLLKQEQDFLTATDE
jgi:hypothetical protein